MMRSLSLALSAGIVGLYAMPSVASAVLLLQPTDFIIAIDADHSASRFPSGEAPVKMFDGDAGTKYLNFGRENSGFIVTPAAGPAIIQSFTLTTANDALERDPASWVLYGTNAPIVSGINTNGTAEAWTQIGSGTLALPDTRKTAGPVVSVPNSTAYGSYKLVFPTLKNAAATNSMQVADVAMYQSADGTGPSYLSTADVVLAVDADVVKTSNYPAPNETPAKAIDGTTGKYLNFGQRNSGFIVTPSVGESIVKSFQITTANDTAGRDPIKWALYGTNAPIVSADNSWGEDEPWTLIDSGDVALPTDRLKLGPVVDVDNDTMYKSYKMVFPELRDFFSNSMQIAEIQFDGLVPEPAGLSILAFGGLLALARRRR